MSDIPIIKSAPQFVREPKYPFHKMEVGDAFDMPRNLGFVSSNLLDRRHRNIRMAANYYIRTKNPDARFTVNCIDRDTVRCRRTA